LEFRDIEEIGSVYSGFGVQRGIGLLPVLLDVNGAEERQLF